MFKKSMVKIFILAFYCFCQTAWGFEKMPFSVANEAELLQNLKQSGVFEASEVKSLKYNNDMTIIHVRWDFGSGIRNYISFLYICNENQCLYLSSIFTGSSIVDLLVGKDGKKIQLVGGGRRFLLIENIMGSR